MELFTYRAICYFAERGIASHRFLCRYDFIEFIRNGGRRPHAQPEPLTRQGSIELVSEASDPGQAEQPPPPPPSRHQNPDPAPVQFSSPTMNDAHMGAALSSKGSDAHHQLPPKLPLLQTAVCQHLDHGTPRLHVPVI